MLLINIVDQLHFSTKCEYDRVLCALPEPDALRVAATCAADEALSTDVTYLTSGLSSRETRRTAERPLRHVCLPRPVVV